MSAKEGTTGTDMVLSPRQERLQAVRDDMAPGARPAAIVPRNFVEAQQMCQALAVADLIPKAFRGKPADMLLVIMTGSELGIPPMASMRLFTTWDGVPRLMAEGVRAVLISHPEIEYFEPSTSDEKHATWIGKRRGRPEKSVTWTMERAKRAGLDRKENWTKYQEAMLHARASMDLGRMLAPDIVAGMRSLEEAQDGDFVETSTSTVEVKREFIAPAPSVAPSVDRPKRGPGRPRNDERAAIGDPIVLQQGSNPGESIQIQDPMGPMPLAMVAEVDRFQASIDRARASDAARAASLPALPAQDAQDVWGQPIAFFTPAASPAAPSPSTESAPESGVESGAESFGEDPVDVAPEPAKNRLQDFFAELAKCATQREVVVCGNKWRSWSKEQAMAGDTTYGKGGSNSDAMGKAYATRKSEVPA